MKLLFDFRAYQEYKGRGVARYVYQMFESAIKQHSGTNYILIFKDKPAPVFCEEITKRIETCYYEDLKNDRYKNIAFDAFINGTHYLPSLNADEAISVQYPTEVLSCCRNITCIVHDVTPLFFGQYIPEKNQKISFALQTEALRYIDHIFTNSLFTLYSGMRYLDRPKADFTCLYGGADIEKFTTDNSNKPYDSRQRKNHLVYVSGAAPQKNSVGITRAFCKAYRKGTLPKDAKLFIVCRAPREFVDTIKYETEKCKVKYGRQVEATGYIPDEKMIELLKGARASIFPSFYEGLGLPILESYVAGTPCWASNVSATQEVVLPKCSFDPFDEDAMVSAVEKIFFDEKLCIESLEFGRELIKKMSWQNGAKAMLCKLHDLCR